MPLAIGLATVQNPGQEYPAHRLSFDDDGYYWFCRPAFEELGAKTGQVLAKFSAAIAEAEASDKWLACLGD